MRDLLTESGSIFVQIGDENVHRVRAVMDEVFGSENFVSQIVFRKTTGRAADFIRRRHRITSFGTRKNCDVIKYRHSII